MMGLSLSRLLAAVGISAAGVLVFLVAFASDQRRVGALGHAAKVEQNNARLSKAARNAGNRSLDPAVRGVQNPYYRD